MFDLLVQQEHANTQQTNRKHSHCAVHGNARSKQSILSLLFFYHISGMFQKDTVRVTFAQSHLRAWDIAMYAPASESFFVFIHNACNTTRHILSDKSWRYATVCCYVTTVFPTDLRRSYVLCGFIYVHIYHRLYTRNHADAFWQSQECATWYSLWKTNRLIRVNHDLEIRN